MILGVEIIVGLHLAHMLITHFDAQQDERFENIVSGLGLQWRGTAGEHTDAVDSVYDISNSARLKKTEVRRPI